VIWAKTDAGRAEVQSRALIKVRSQRNLLLLIDGHKTEEMLLAGVAGITPDDFSALEAMGLIEPLLEPPARTASRSAAPAPAAPPAAARTSAPVPLGAAQAPAAADEDFDYAGFTEALTQLIAKELGLRGFALTLAVEKASTPQELKDVAKRTIEQIREKKGSSAAESARRALFGR
jgi:hypothetical protein